MQIIGNATVLLRAIVVFRLNHVVVTRRTTGCTRCGSTAAVFFNYASAARKVLHRFEGYPPRSLNISPDQSEALFAQLVNEQADLSVLSNLDALIGED